MGKGKAFEKIDDYLDSITISKGTRGTYRSQLRTFVRWCGENGFHTIATGAAMYEHHIKREYEGKSSGRSILYTVRGFARWVADAKADATFDFSKFDDLGQASLRARPRLDKTDLSFICNTAPRRGEAGRRDRTMLLLAVTAGLTPAEIASIMPEDLLVTADAAWLKVGDEDSPVKLAPIARDALLDYLAQRDYHDDGKPLIALSSDKNRRPMRADDVRKSIAKLLGYLEYRYDEVLNGDMRFVLASYAGRLDESSLRKVANLATSLYYSDMRL